MKIVLISLFLLNISINNAQNEKIDIKIINAADDKSFAIGEKTIQYNNYYLFDVISEITEIPYEFYNIKIDLDKNPIVNFKVNSLKKIDKYSLIISVFKKLKKDFNIELSISKKSKEVKVLYCLDINLLKTCSKDVFESKLTIVNRMFIGNCINTKQIIEQINSWYNLNLVDGLDINNKYNFEMHHANSYEELMDELSYYYSIYVKKEIRNIETLNIKFL